jgi:hypothetical protein
MEGREHLDKVFKRQVHTGRFGELTNKEAGRLQ